MHAISEQEPEHRRRREIRQGAQDLGAGLLIGGGPSPRDRPLPVELGAGDEEEIGEQVDAIGPAGTPLTGLEQHQVEGEVTDDADQDAAHQAAERLAVLVERPAQQHGGDAEQQQETGEREGVGQQGERRAVTLGIGRRPDGEVPDEHDAAGEHHGGVEDELPALHADPAAEREHQQADEEKDAVGEVEEVGG